jgi:hypothetical protein
MASARPEIARKVDAFEQGLTVDLAVLLALTHGTALGIPLRTHEVSA